MEKYKSGKNTVRISHAFTKDEIIKCVHDMLFYGKKINKTNALIHLRFLFYNYGKTFFAQNILIDPSELSVKLAKEYFPEFFSDAN